MAKGIRRIFVFLVLIIPLVWCATSLSQRMVKRAAVVKLGFTPPSMALKLMSAEHSYAVAEVITLKVLMYFGSLVVEWKNQVLLPPEYFNMFRTLETALKLDPYNADVYYFAQAAFTWDAGRAKDVNRFLEYGMKYRTWDPMLPFFAGFNAAYFLQDYESAAQHMQRAAEISKNPSMARLASRYHYESGSTELAIDFLEDMIRSAPSRQESDIYQLRKDALVAIKVLQDAIDAYCRKMGSSPNKIENLLVEGILSKLPVDPYGGSFYIDEMGKVRSSSRLAQKTTLDPIERDGHE